MLFFVGCHGVLAHAPQHVPSGLAAVMLATIPLWTVIVKVQTDVARQHQLLCAWFKPASL